MRNKNSISKQIFPVHKVVGRYEIDGTITFVAPSPLPRKLTKILVDEQVRNLVREKMVADLFQ